MPSIIYVTVYADRNKERLGKFSMNDFGKKSCGSDCKHIKGINCAVKNCVYHDGESYCTAEHINVAPSNATSSSETACATFKSQH